MGGVELDNLGNKYHPKGAEGSGLNTKLETRLFKEFKVEMERLKSETDKKTETDGAVQQSPVSSRAQSCQQCASRGAHQHSSHFNET